MTRAHSTPAPMRGGPVTAESITAILSNLGDNPHLLAETLTGLAAAAQAQVWLAWTHTLLCCSVTGLGFSAALFRPSSTGCVPPQSTHPSPPHHTQHTHMLPPLSLQAAHAAQIRGPNGPPPMHNGPSAPQPIPGRFDNSNNGPNGMHSAMGSYDGPMKGHPAMSGSLPNADNLSRTAPATSAMMGNINPAALTPDLLPLLKEIWNK